MKHALVRNVLFLLGVVILALVMVVMAREATMIANWSQSGFVLTSVSNRLPGALVFWGIEEEDFEDPAVLPTRRDTVLTIGGQPAALPVWIEELEAPHEPGKRVDVTFVQQGDTLHNALVTRPVQTRHLILTGVMQVLKLLILLSFFGVGFWALARRGRSGAVRALALYSFCMAAIMGSTYMPMFPVMASFVIPFEGVLTMTLNVASAWFSGAWLLFNMIFPRPVPLARRHPWSPYALAFGPVLLLTGAILIEPSLLNVIGVLLFFMYIPQVFGGLLVLRYQHQHAESNLERRQTRLIFWGSGAGLVLFLLFALDGNSVLLHVRYLELHWRLLITNVVFLVLLASPLSILYAFTRYRLLEVQARLHRGTQYVAVSSVLILLFLALVYLAGEVLLKELGLQTPASAMMVAVVLSLGFLPAHGYFQRRISRHVFPERERLRNMARNFLEEATAMPDLRALDELLKRRLRESLGLDEVHLVLHIEPAETYRLTSGEEIPVEPGGGLTRWLHSATHPLLVDEAVASDRLRFSEPEARWGRERRIALLLPLRVQDRLLGFLALGRKPHGDDFQPEELQILMVLAGQVALLVDNLILVKDHLEKRRLEKEMEVARQVQLGFLPLSLPDTLGLEVAARSSFCHEVAGDYYDVIALEDGRTILAVGDVSGKGAGAALIMANLQASLRAFAGIRLKLSELVARINEMIVRNTEPHQYITFFAALYDPRERTLTHVNAGHNPPLLIDTGAEVRELHTGGLILGSFPGVEYREETVALNPGDSLLIYTDGLTESMSPAGEEFGEARVLEAALELRHEAPGDILQRLIDRAAHFRGGAAPGDDVTLLFARVLE